MAIFNSYVKLPEGMNWNLELSNHWLLWEICQINFGIVASLYIEKLWEDCEVINYGWRDNCGVTMGLLEDN